MIKYSPEPNEALAKPCQIEVSARSWWVQSPAGLLLSYFFATPVKIDTEQRCWARKFYARMLKSYLNLITSSYSIKETWALDWFQRSRRCLHHVRPVVSHKEKNSCLPIFGWFIIGQAQASCTDGLQAPPWASLGGSYNKLPRLCRSTIPCYKPWNPKN